jgi:hypothetical protein
MANGRPASRGTAVAIVLLWLAATVLVFSFVARLVHECPVKAKVGSFFERVPAIAG